MLKILVSDKLAQEGLDLLEQMDDVEVTVKTGLTEDELASIIADYDGLIIRSGTNVTAKVLAQSTRLRAIARAGVGVDNVDVATATRKGIVVMNTPDGNTISAAEHTLALMLALSRHVVQGCTTLKAGKWDRKRFMGTQLMGKTLGVIGLGRIGLAVAQRAKGLNMVVLGCDPLASPQVARESGIELCQDLDELCKTSDFLTLHVPVTDETRGMIDARRIALMKPTARLINVARGPIVNENDLYKALSEKRIAGAALDVFAEEPPQNRAFEKLENCIVTPHLGASTEEAQIEVAVEAARQLVEALKGQQMRNAVNVPGLDKSLPEMIKKYRVLAERLGCLVSSMTPGSIQKVVVTYRGEIADMDTAILTTSLSVGLLQRHFEEHLNIINTPLLAKQRGVSIDEVRNPESQDYSSTIGVTVVSDKISRSVLGTIIGKNNLRMISLDDYDLEMIPEGPILIIFNNDRPGVIGAIGTICGKHDINIGTMGVGRIKTENRAVLVLDIDETPSEKAVEELRKQDFVNSVYVCELPCENES